MIPVNCVTLFTAGLVLDVLTALYYFAVSRDKIFLAVILNFLCVEFGYISWIYLMNQAKLEENLQNVHWYAVGCAVGTMMGLSFALWRRRRAQPKEEPPKPVRRRALLAIG